MDSKTLYISVTTALKTAACVAEIGMYTAKDEQEWHGVRSAACEIYMHLSAHNPKWPKRSQFLKDCGVWLACDGDW